MYANYMGYIEIFLVFVSLLFLFCHSFKKIGKRLTKRPFMGALPTILKNRHRIHDYIVEVMETGRITFFVKGPWFTKMKLLVTADPANVQHVLSKNFGNYTKGSKFYEIFEILGEGIFNTDSEMWKYHRKMAQSILGNPKFNQFLIDKVWAKIETGLVPILNHVSKEGLEIELQDIFGRLTFDTIHSVMVNYDPRTLSIDLPSNPLLKAIIDGEEAILGRFLVPSCVWKFQRWLGVGQEKKLKIAWKIGDDFLYDCISRKREEMRKNSQSNACAVGNESGIDLLTLYMNEVSDIPATGGGSDKFLRDTIINFLLAGRDTTNTALAWFFYLIAKNPHVQSKIKEELDAMIAQVKSHQGDGGMISYPFKLTSKQFEELSDKVIYLHAAICEALRLYPPVPTNCKAPIEPDILPSGHKVDSSTQIIISAYAMARLKSVWGEDCCEFKPERWIQETGKIIYVPSYKFSAFSSGPRNCLGKKMTFTVMKAVAVAILSKYHIKLVEGHPVLPETSVVLHMKHGFKAKVATY